MTNCAITCDNGVLSTAGGVCNVNINECSSSPCVKGVCVDQVNAFVCQCQPGYAGEHTVKYCSIRCTFMLLDVWVVTQHVCFVFVVKINLNFNTISD